MSTFQDSVQQTHPALATDSQHVFGTDSLIRRPVRRLVPMQNETTGNFPAGLVSGNDSLSDSIQQSKPLQLFTSPITPHHPTTKYLDLYKGHELHPRNSEPIVRKDVSPDWFFPILMLVIFVFTWLRIFYSKYFSQMIQALLNNNLTNQIVRDENILVQRASVYLSVAFHLIGAMFLYLVSIHYKWDLGGIGNGFPRFLFFSILVSAIYSLKFLFLKICGWLFDLDREMATYIFNIFLINNAVGLALIPIIALLAYNQWIASSYLIIAGAILAFAGLFYRSIRGIFIGFSTPGFSLPYLLLFLLTFELAPLMVIIRLIL